MNQNDFPTKEIVENGINKLNTLALPVYDKSLQVNDYIDAIIEIIRKELGLVLHIGKPTKQNEFKFPIYRVRELKSISNPNLFHEHSYPPSNMTGMGRCNFPKYPVFYGSTDPSVAILEVLRSYKPTNTEYCISVWDVEQKEENFFLQLFLNVPLPEENPFRGLYGNLKSKLKEESFKSLELSDDQLDAIELYLSYLDHKFIEDTGYSLSAVLAHRCMYMDHSFRADMLMYPSIQAEMKGVNLAISPNFVDNCMKLRRLYTIKVNNVNLDQGTFNLSLGKCGIIQKNVIHWISFNMDSPEHKVLIARDFEGFFSD